jgi:hypothetical protein
MNSWHGNGGKAAHILPIEAGFSRIKSSVSQSPYFYMLIEDNFQAIGAMPVGNRVKTI